MSCISILKTAGQNRKSASLISYEVKVRTTLSIVYPAGLVSFRHKEGLPIKLSVQSAALLQVTCEHGRLHLFELDIQPDVKWIIKDELKKAGAFKICHGGDDEYLARDNGECVVYYPPPDISVGQEIRTDILILTAAADKETLYNATLILRRQNGFGKGVSYASQLQLLAQDAGIDTPKLGKDDPCQECNIRIEAEQPSLSVANISRYMITSEYVKLSATEERKGGVWLINRTNKTKVDGLCPAAKFAGWKCTAGSFIGGGNGLSTIYLTPKDNELSKSPVLVEFHHDSKTNAKKVWLLRRQSAMHC